VPHPFRVFCGTGGKPQTSTSNVLRNGPPYIDTPEIDRKASKLDKHDASTPTSTKSIAEQAGVSVERIRYHGWPESFLLSNRHVEAVVVPVLSRVMRFGLVGEPEDAFWQNRELDGQLPTTGVSEWANFGGDKCWPAPQSDWLARTGQAWPPPTAFDARLAEVSVVERGVVLTSPIDSAYGIQMVRTVQLDPIQPVMRIATEFRKLQGPAVEVAIWTITQLREPEAVLLWLPAPSRFPRGYIPLQQDEPAELNRRGRLLSLKRSPNFFTKIGSDAGSMAWLGKTSVLRIDAEVGPGEYPDGGCVTEVYTNPDPRKYVELETMGPLLKINSGERIRRTTIYTALPRRAHDMKFEAEDLFNGGKTGHAGIPK
jgi:hypothetical protein